jgi:hypothetical protein
MRKAAKTPLRLALLGAVVSAVLGAIELQPGTLKAWEDYIQRADFRMRERLQNQQPFLWSDEAPSRGARLRHGEILVAPLVGAGTARVPGGLIHDWIGAVFIPNVTLRKLLAVLHDYESYKEYYKPVVVDSRALASSEEDQRYSVVLQHHVLFVSAAILAHCRARDLRVDGRRGYKITDTTEVQEIESYGQARERLLPPGQGNGYIWRLHLIVRYEERNGGVYLELEALGLTREIPFSLYWLVSPVVKRVSADSLETSLRQTRDAVVSSPERSEWVTPCAPDRGNLGGSKAGTR